jgi:hypothetical protein
MLPKSWCIAVGAFTTVTSALFTDLETGSQPGMKVDFLYQKYQS